MKHFHQPLYSLFLLLFSFACQAEDPCQRTASWVKQAHQDYIEKRPIAEGIDLLQRSIKLCPTDAYAHNNLAVLLEAEKQYDAAIQHYQQAIELKKDFSAPWFGLGDIYKQQQQGPLSFEAYLQACVLGDKEAPSKVMKLLEKRRYASVETGELLQKASLQLLFDDQRQQALQKLLQQCALPKGENQRAVLKRELVIRNIQFATASSALPAQASEQLEQIASALQSVDFQRIVISGHTDKQGFRGLSAKQSREKNQHLSEQRSASVKAILARYGLTKTSIITQGYGDQQPLNRGHSREDYRLNRRVEINVE